MQHNGCKVIFLYMLCTAGKCIDAQVAEAIEGELDVANAIGKTATVYLPIPPGGTGFGKVNVTVQEKYIEVDAITLANRKISTGETVRIVGKDEIGRLTVEPLVSES